VKNTGSLTAANHTLFPTWNEVWSENEGNRPLMDRLGSLWERRSRGNQNVAGSFEGIDKASVAEALRGIEAALAVQHIPDRDTVADWRADLDLPLRLERWNRWLHLEHALKIASASGDLLSVALILRSLGEEVIRLLVLDHHVQSPYLMFAISDDATSSWMAGALIASEPLIRSIGDAIKKDGSPYFDLAAGVKATSSVRNVLFKLNDYAHPNFGSHFLALFPEESAASTTILESACECVIRPMPVHDSGRCRYTIPVHAGT